MRIRVIFKGMSFMHLRMAESLLGQLAMVTRDTFIFSIVCKKYAIARVDILSKNIMSMR
ncbi:hypothetical protein [Clostridium butyricum]|nr:hypothetical protein [Clostridium butyricum]